ncbi:MAG: helix-turn-helix domain-containing protein, partial [Methyloprofundus sp.]|nr:helix-turn-helix domain-containing protein [Methyloprofundus sp.]
QELLQTFCSIAPGQRSQVSFIVEKSANEAEIWFSYNGITVINNDIQMELYRISSMIQLVQLATGANWTPEQIHLLMPATTNTQACELLNKSEVSFSQFRSGISIPKILLQLPVKLDVIETLSRHYYDINANFVDTIRNLIAIYISHKDCKIEMIAKATEIPVRTLQRRLKQQGVCFNDLLNQAKFALAKNKLEHSYLAITDISLQLGYASPAHFTRAFKR